MSFYSDWESEARSRAEDYDHLLKLAEQMECLLDAAVDEGLSEDEDWFEEYKEVKERLLDFY